MNSTTTKPERLAALERQIERLQRRLHILEQRSNRYGWIRVGTFFGGGGLSVLCYLLASWWLCLPVAIFVLAAFSVEVYYHRQIKRSIVRHSIWQHIQSTQVARITLNWDDIAPAHTNDPGSNHPFAIDLDITGRHSLHRLLNTSASVEGSQRLLDWLTNTEPELSLIQHRQQLVQELTPQTLFRNKLLLKSLLTTSTAQSRWEGKQLLRWLETHSNEHGLLPLMFLSMLFSIITLALFVLNLLALLPAYWIIALVLMIVFLAVTKERRGDLFEEAGYLSDAFAQLSTVFEYLESYRYGKHEAIRLLCQPFFTQKEQRPSVLMSRIARIAAAATLERNGLLWILLNVLMPWDFYLAYLFSRYRKQIAANLPTWLDVWYELEALNSLANFAYLNPDYSMPAVTQDVQDRPVFSASELGHPLIPFEKKVVNDFALAKPGEITIITGSNMSGKSTFLRTLGINLCLAYAGGPVNASSFHTALFRLFTCIRINDSVTEGYSYFYAEVKRLKALLVETEKEQERPVFFLIDEIFRGTNNRERRIGSESYITALAERNCLGVISTHDLELVHLADVLSQVQNYHFREEVVDGQMVFDYILRHGPCPTTNALKIMQMEGLPVSITGNEQQKSLY